MANGPRYLVELRAEGPGPPAYVRLKRWLKASLRAYGLRCTRAEQLPDVQGSPPGDDPPTSRPEPRPDRSA